MLIQTTPEAQADGDLADYYAGQRRAWGFLPDYAGAFSTRPEVAAAWNTLNLAIRSAMDRRRFEIATIAAARARRSTYCTVAHSMFLRDVCQDAPTLESIADRPDGSGLAPIDRAVFAFAERVATDPSSIGPADIDHLHEVGLDDEAIADVVFAAAARCFFTAVLDGLGARLDPQTAQTFEPRLLGSMLVGRPVGPG